MNDTDATARLESVIEANDKFRASADSDGQGTGSTRFAGTEIRPPKFPDYGMTTEQLSESQRRFTSYARLRLSGTGHREYSRGDHQSFEDLSMHRLIDETLDELADTINYVSMLAISFERLKRRAENIA